MTASITGYTGDKGISELVLPNTISWLGGEYTITSITSSSLLYTNGVFYNCTALTSVTIPDGLTEIGNFVFYGCSSLTSINLPDGLKEIGRYAFCMCSSLTSIDFPEGLRLIDKFAFNYCTKLATVQFNGLIAIGIDAFNKCPGVITNTIEGDGYIFQAVNNMATITGYQSTPYGEYTVPSAITVNSTEYYVTSIYEEVFQDCTYITSLTLPECLINIDKKAFYDCSKLTEIKVNWETPLTVTSSNVFSTSIYSSATLSVPVGTLAVYRADSFWGQFSKIVEDSTLTVEDAEFDSVKVYTVNGVVMVSGAEDGAAIKVYNLNGTNVANGVVLDGAAQIELPTASGIYIVTVGNQSYKVAR